MANGMLICMQKPERFSGCPKPYYALFQEVFTLDE